MSNGISVSEHELIGFVRHYAQRGYWNRADRRTREGKAQLAALARGWIASAPPGTGYRVVFGRETDEYRSEIPSSEEGSKEKRSYD